MAGWRRNSTSGWRKPARVARPSASPWEVQRDVRVLPALGRLRGLRGHWPLRPRWARSARRFTLATNIDVLTMADLYRVHAGMRIFCNFRGAVVGARNSSPAPPGALASLVQRPGHVCGGRMNPCATSEFTGQLMFTLMSRISWSYPRSSIAAGVTELLSRHLLRPDAAYGVCSRSGIHAGHHHAVVRMIALPRWQCDAAGRRYRRLRPARCGEGAVAALSRKSLPCRSQFPAPRHRAGALLTYQGFSGFAARGCSS